MKFVLLLLLVGCTFPSDEHETSTVAVTYKHAIHTHGGCGGRYAEYKLRESIRFCTQECGNGTIPIPCEFYDELK